MNKELIPMCYECHIKCKKEVYTTFDFFVCPSCKQEVDKNGMALGAKPKTNKTTSSPQRDVKRNSGPLCSVASCLNPAYLVVNDQGLCSQHAFDHYGAYDMNPYTDSVISTIYANIVKLDGIDCIDALKYIMWDYK